MSQEQAGAGEDRAAAGQGAWRRPVALAGSALAVAAVWLAAYRSLLLPWGRPEKLLSSDYMLQFFPWLSYGLRNLAQGVIPWWTNLAGCGEPLVGKLETGVFFPPHLLLLPFLRDGQLPFYIAQAYQAAAILVSALGVLLLLRRLGAGALGSALGACLWVSSWDLAFHLAYVSFTDEVMVFPYLVWLYLRGLERQSYRDLGGAGLLWGLTLLSGNPQWALMHLLLLGLLGLGLTPGSWGFWRQGLGLGGLVKALWPVAFIALVGVLLAAVQLIPAWELYRHSPRTASGLAFASSDKFTVEFVLHRLLLDNPFGKGGLFLFLAAMAPLLARRRLAWLLAVLALLAADLTRGDSSLLYRLFYYALPGFGLFRFPGRFLHLSIFALALLAALGLRHLWSPQGPPAWRALLGPLLLALLLAAHGKGGRAFWWMSLAQAAGLAACLALADVTWARRGVLVGLLASALVWPAFMPLGDDKWLKTDLDYYQVTPQVAYLRQELGHYRLTNPGALLSHPQAAAYWEFHKSTCQGGLLWGTATWSAAAQLHLHALDIFASKTGYHRLFDLLGIKYLPLGLDPPPPLEYKYQPVELAPGRRVQLDLGEQAGRPGRLLARVSGGPLRVAVKAGQAREVTLVAGDNALDLAAPERLLQIAGLEGRNARIESLSLDGRDLLAGQPRWGQAFSGVLVNRFALDKCWLVTDYLVRRDDDQVLAALQGLEPSLSVVLREEPDFTVGAGSTGGEGAPAAGGGDLAPGQARLLTYEQQALEVLCHAQRPSLLVVNDTFYPGWRAWVDGRPVRLLKADYLFRAVALPPGRHLVRMEYAPWWRWPALLLSLTGLGLGLLGPLALARWRPPWGAGVRLRQAGPIR